MSEQGRWKGRLTSRPLPSSDGDIEQLDATERADIARVWHTRAASERRVAGAFVIVADALVELRAGSAIVELAQRAIDDEHRHAAICSSMASRIAGTDLGPPGDLALSVPTYEGASDELTSILRVFGHCTLNETTATAFLEASLRAARSDLARAALRELLSDEVDHARIGWAHLGSLGASARASMQRWLLPMMQGNVRAWRDANRLYPASPAAAEWGAPSAADVDTALTAAVRDLVVPGLERCGFELAEVRAWADAGCRTDDARA